MTLLEMLTGIRAALIADAAVNALVAGRIYSEQAQQGGDYPALVYRLVSAPRPLNLTDYPGVVRARVDVDVLDDGGLVSVMELSGLVVAALTAADGVTVNGERVQIERDTVTNASQFDGDTVVRTVEIDFLVTFTED